MRLFPWGILVRMSLSGHENYPLVSLKFLIVVNFTGFLIYTRKFWSWKLRLSFRADLILASIAQLPHWDVTELDLARIFKSFNWLSSSKPLILSFALITERFADPLCHCSWQAHSTPAGANENTLKLAKIQAASSGVFLAVKCFASWDPWQFFTILSSVERSEQL